MVSVQKLFNYRSPRSVVWQVKSCLAVYLKEIEVIFIAFFDTRNII